MTPAKKPTRPHYPPTFLALVNRFRKKGTVGRYIYTALASFFMITGINTLILSDASTGFVVIATVAPMFFCGWYFVWESSLSHTSELLERDLQRFPDRDDVIREIEAELDADPIIGSEGALTASWVISAHVYNQPLVWPLEELDVVDWKTGRGYRDLRLYFVSGKHVVLANSWTEAHEMYDKLENRFGSIAVTPEAAEYLDGINFPPDLIRERIGRI